MAQAASLGVLDQLVLSDLSDHLVSQVKMEVPVLLVQAALPEKMVLMAYQEDLVEME